ncbi:hypothetical protein JHK84_039206 [Glycine max]|nr:hypothetical protein JHK84_039206 [Glycine max]
MEETKWVVQINEELKSDGASVPEKEQWKRHSIYKIPSRIFRSDYGVPDDYADNDTVFGEHGKLNVVPYLKRDMHAYA